MELAAWERAQPGFTVIAVRAPAPEEDLVTVRLGTGQGSEVPLGSDRTQIHQLLRAVLPEVSPPDLGDERGAVPAEASGHEIWAELLDDLGAYEHLLHEMSPRLSLVSAATDGSQATITLTDGDSVSPFPYRVEGGEVPFGLLTDLAADFVNHIGGVT
jgi:hypothetical protein